MRRLALLLALAACKQDPPPTPPDDPAHTTTPDLTCDDLAKHPLIADDEAMREKVLAYCASHPEEMTQPLLRCMVDAKTRSEMDFCEDGPPEPEGEPGRSEAELALDAIKAGVKAYHAQHAAFPKGSEPLTPTDPCCASGSSGQFRCPVDAALWTTATWDALAFSVDEPAFFQYAYESDGATFTARAVGDLDCDDTTMTYTLEGEAGAGGPVYRLTKPERME